MAHVASDGRPPRLALLGTLLLVSAVAPMGIDLSLPGFTAMVEDFGVAPSALQTSLTAFLIGLAAGQMIIGPISDRLGRRAPLLISIVLFLVASVGCALAPTIEWFVASRLIQGVAGSGGIVLSKVIVADSTEGRTTVRTLGLLTTLGGGAVVVAPVLGAGLVMAWGWRSTFWMMAVLAALMLLSAATTVPETMQRSRSERLDEIPGGSVVSQPRPGTFTLYSLSFILAFCCFFAYVSASPLLLHSILGLSLDAYALVFAMNAMATVIVGALSAKLAKRIDPRLLAALGFGGLIASALLTMTAFASPESPLPAILSLTAVMGSLGMIIGNTSGLAIGAAKREQLGFSAALLGAAQFLAGAAVAPLAVLGGETDPTPATGLMVAAAVLATLVFAFAARPANRSVPINADLSQHK